jgi:hypothetical protein
MKRWLAFGLCSVGIGVLVSTIEQGYADENDRATKCTLATLKGQYPFASSGTLFPPAFGVTKTSKSNAAGYNIYNGDGTGTSVVTFTVNGVNQNVASPTPITYTLNPDCTGTLTVLPRGPHFDIFVALNGEEVALISTDQGFAVSEGPDRRVGPK